MNLEQAATPADTERAQALAATVAEEMQTIVWNTMQGHDFPGAADAVFQGMLYGLLAAAWECRKRATTPLPVPLVDVVTDSVREYCGIMEAEDLIGPAEGRA